MTHIGDAPAKADTSCGCCGAIDGHRGYCPLGKTDTANPKDLVGQLKPSIGLVPVGAMEEVARVMELGAKKYGAYNWRSRAVKKMVYAHAALRHLCAWIGGQDKDPESGRSHLAHVAACMMIVLDAETVGNAIEDRVWLPNAPEGSSKDD